MTWNECKKNIDGFKGSVYKKFTNFQDADAFCRTGPESVKPSQHVTPQQPQSDQSLIFMYTDGSYISQKNYAGYAFAIPDLNIEGHGLVDFPKTNNRAELTAVIKCLESIPPKLTSSLMLVTDSKYVILLLTSTGRRYKENGYTADSGRDLVPNDDLIEKMLNLVDNYPGSIQTMHVFAHTGAHDVHSVWNNKVDELSRRGQL